MLSRGSRVNECGVCACVVVLCGSWLVAIGGWQLVGDNWWPAIGGWQLQLVTVGWWQLVGGDNWWVAIGW